MKSILELRTEYSLSRQQFCQLFNIPYRTVQDWELGNRTCPEYLVELIEYKLSKEKKGSTKMIIYEVATTKYGSNRNEEGDSFTSKLLIDPSAEEIKEIIADAEYTFYHLSDYDKKHCFIEVREYNISSDSISFDDLPALKESLKKHSDAGTVESLFFKNKDASSLIEVLAEQGGYDIAAEFSI